MRNDRFGREKKKERGKRKEEEKKKERFPCRGALSTRAFITG